jgi:hypothetical protein
MWLFATELQLRFSTILAVAKLFCVDINPVKNQKWKLSSFLE